MSSATTARRIRCRLATGFLAVVAASLPAHAAGPLLHEFIEPDAAEDLALETTTSDGTMPAAMTTESGIVQAPREERAPAPSERAYGGSSPSSLDATYQIDSDTRQPDVVHYDDPFSPAITPFKRLYAYDAVSPTFELVVHRKALTPLPVGGDVKPGDDAFYADMFVDVEKGVPSRIPTVGPGTRVLSAHIEPPSTFRVLVDGAENWFLEADQRARVRLVMRLAVNRRAFGSEFGTTSWSALGARATSLPADIQPEAAAVAAQIGVSTDMTPGDVVRRLVGYFRAFQPSDARPTSRGPQLYRDLASSQKGVCRHRSYAFVITALHLGLPARMVRNEAHAWVEVWDSEIWHRIDLGGAAGRLEAPPDDGRPFHVTPTDPYAWPEGSESGLGLAEGARPPGGSGNGTGPPRGAADDGGAPTGAPSGEPLGPPLDADAGVGNPERPPASLTLELRTTSSVFRGNPVTLHGRVEADGAPCAHARVDVALSLPNRRARPIGSLSADAKGVYSGQVVIPLDADVGEYDIVVSTPGDARCGPGTAQ